LKIKGNQLKIKC